MAESAHVGTSSDRRGSSRRRTLKTAQIQSLDRNRTFDCAVRNLSASGALVVLPSTAGVPDAFHLVIPSEDRTLRCKVTWRDLRRLGVTFLPDEGK